MRRGLWLGVCVQGRHEVHGVYRAVCVWERKAVGVASPWRQRAMFMPCAVNPSPKSRHLQCSMSFKGLHRGHQYMQ